MRLTAAEWGRAHGSCDEAMEWRRGLGTATQRTAWRRRQRGDWMIWQLAHGLTRAELPAVLLALQRACARIMERSIRMHALHCEIEAVEVWAAQWLSGADRMETTARAAVDASWPRAPVIVQQARLAQQARRTATAAWLAAGAVREASQDMVRSAIDSIAEAQEMAMEALPSSRARAVELRLQARDIHREISKWPGKA